MSLESRLITAFVTIAQDVKNLFTRTIPLGGTSGQVLVKNSGSDNDVSWQTMVGSSGIATFVQETDPLAVSPYIWYKTDTNGKVIDILKG